MDTITQIALIGMYAAGGLAIGTTVLALVSWRANLRAQRPLQATIDWTPSLRHSSDTPQE